MVFGTLIALSTPRPGPARRDESDEPAEEAEAARA
jgi:hypothetical protein